MNWTINPCALCKIWVEEVSCILVRTYTGYWNCGNPTSCLQHWKLAERWLRRLALLEGDIQIWNHRQKGRVKASKNNHVTVHGHISYVLLGHTISSNTLLKHLNKFPAEKKKTYLIFSHHNQTYSHLLKMTKNKCQWEQNTVKRYYGEQNFMPNLQDNQEKLKTFWSPL